MPKERIQRRPNNGLNNGLASSAGAPPASRLARAYLAVTYIKLGREEEARAAAAKLLRIYPKFSLNYYAKIDPYKDKSVVDDIVACLRKAGLPE